MRALARPLLVATLVGGAFLATPASATTRCVGEQTIFYACVVTPRVDTSGETVYCFYTGGSSCTEVAVPTPGLDGDVDVYCEGPATCRLIDITQR
jgi:hypothetical protein